MLRLCEIYNFLHNLYFQNLISESELDSTFLAACAAQKIPFEVFENLMLREDPDD